MGVGLVGDATKRRLFAASVDNLLAMFVALMTASYVPELGLAAHAPLIAATGVYLAYFLVQEALWSNTVGKRLFGLRLCCLDGSPCGWAEAAGRTATRIIEVNPVLFGGLPAAQCWADAPGVCRGRGVGRQYG